MLGNTLSLEAVKPSTIWPSLSIAMLPASSSRPDRWAFTAERRTDSSADCGSRTSAPRRGRRPSPCGSRRVLRDRRNCDTRGGNITRSDNVNCRSGVNAQNYRPIRIDSLSLASPSLSCSELRASWWELKPFKSILLFHNSIHRNLVFTPYLR